jgi:Holliday junction resolvasome RuvABC endonuclease subunit
MRILGLDASTSAIGIAIIEYDDLFNCKLLYADYYTPDKSIDIIDMLLKARIYISNIAKQYKIDEFVIEDYIRFMKGSSSAATVIPLAILNMTLRLMIIDIFNIKPESLNVLKIRHALKLTKELPKKEDIPNLVAKHLKIEYPWLYKVNKRTKKPVLRKVTKEPVIQTESYDIADAIAVALAFIKLKESPKKSRSKK